MHFSEIMRFVYLQSGHLEFFLLKPRDESSFHNVYRHKRFLAVKQQERQGPFKKIAN